MKYHVFESIEEVDEGFKYVNSFTEVFKNGDIQTYHIVEREDSIFKKRLKTFIKKYKFPAIVDAKKTVASYKIIKGYSEADLLQKLKKIEEDLNDKWRIISDLHQVTIKGILVWYVEIARINFEFLKNL